MIRPVLSNSLKINWDWRVLLLGTIGLFPGCAHLQTTKVPIPTLGYPASSGTHASTLVVFLPGRGGSMRDFEKHGFITEMRNAGIEADAIAVDAHLGYYYRRTIIDRLSADVFIPARKNGYKRIVVVGISLGGLGGVLCTRDVPEAVDALVLLSPYLGDKAPLFEQINRSGGPEAWAKGRDAKKGDVGEEVWSFLGQHHSQLPPTWLAMGSQDYLGQGQRLFATLLSPSHVIVIDGTHSWKTWQLLWKQVCARSEIFSATALAAPQENQIRTEK